MGRSVPAVLSLTVALGCADPGSGRPGDDDGATSGSEESGEAPTDLPNDPDPGDGDGDTTGDGDGDATGDGEPPYAAPLYPDDRVHSPITAFVRDNLASIRALAPAAPADLFMKVGASSTVSTSTLYCFADDIVDLDVHEASLGPTLDFFLLGEAGTTTPFDRDTLAAMVGKTAAWAIAGSPSPLEQEWAAIGPAGPSLALIHYGTNDMQQGLTFASAMPGFFASMSDLLDMLIDGGVVPVVFGISRRLDNPAADLWVESYNAVARALAQTRSIPFVDLHLALAELPNNGISADGIHLESFIEGPCILSPEGLTHGYNVRNLIALELLDRLRHALLLGEQLDDGAPVLAGSGTLDDPLLIPALPFADSDSTLGGPSLMLDVYSGCAAAADESGPELIYRLELSEPTPIRAMVLDRAGVDVDIHLLDDTASEAGCIARDDRLLELELEPGTYYFALDTYVDGGGVEQSGAYTFVVLACEAGDADCLL